MALWIRNPLTGLRRAPSVRAGVAVVAGAVGVLLVANVAFGGDINFGDVLVSTYNVRHGLVEPFAATLVFLVGAVWFLGWWKPVLAEPRRALGRRGFVLAAVVVAGPVVDIVRAGSNGFDGVHRTWALVGLVLVAAVEELAVRGALLVGLRDVAVETFVLLVTTLVGGALQLTHFALGESASVSGRTALFAVGIGAACYVVRRLTGRLEAAVAAHALLLVAIAFTGGPGAALGDASREVPVGSAVAVGVALAALVLARRSLFSPKISLPKTVGVERDRPVTAGSTSGPQPWLGERTPF